MPAAKFILSQRVNKFAFDRPEWDGDGLAIIH